MKFATIVCLTLSVLIGQTINATHKVDNLFSYKTNETSVTAPQQTKQDRELFLGFGMSENEKHEERRKEARKDDVKNLIKVNTYTHYSFLIESRFYN